MSEEFEETINALEDQIKDLKEEIEELEDQVSELENREVALYDNSDPVQVMKWDLIIQQFGDLSYLETVEKIKFLK